MGSKSAFTKVLAITGTILLWFRGDDRVYCCTVHRGETISHGLPDSRRDLPGGSGGWSASPLGRPQDTCKTKIDHLGSCSAVVLLVGSQVAAVLTGLASGQAEPAGWQWMLTLAGIVDYELCEVLLGVAGILLVGDLFRKPAMNVNASEPSS